jgi:hypothetical protein
MSGGVPDNFKGDSGAMTAGAETDAETPGTSIPGVHDLRGPCGAVSEAPARDDIPAYRRATTARCSGFGWCRMIVARGAMDTANGPAPCDGVSVAH